MRADASARSLRVLADDATWAAARARLHGQTGLAVQLEAKARGLETRSDLADARRWQPPPVAPYGRRWLDAIAARVRGPHLTAAMFDTALAGDVLAVAA